MGVRAPLLRPVRRRRLGPGVIAPTSPPRPAVVDACLDDPEEATEDLRVALRRTLMVEQTRRGVVIERPT